MNKFECMNRLKILCGLAAAALLPAACATEESIPVNEAAKRYFDAWMQVNHPAAEPSGLGVYIIDDQPGIGASVGNEDQYLFVEYTMRDLKGTIQETNVAKVAQQLGTFDQGRYYGPRVLLNSRAGTKAGFLDVLQGMRVGGTRTAIVPGWLNVTKNYETAEEYLNKESGNPAIYTCTLTGKTDNITKWEIDTLERFVARHMSHVDSTLYGYYYKQFKAPSDTTTLRRDTSFYINYTGRLLNGRVFDTTVKDTAKMYGIYSKTKTYAPVQINLKENFTEITMGSSGSSSTSELVKGFSYCLSKMKKHEKGVCAFYSPYGYSYTGSGKAIPPFAPVSFEIELVDKPKG